MPRQAKAAAKRDEKRKGKTTSTQNSYAGVVGAKGGAAAQVVGNQGNPPVITARFANKSVTEGNKDKPGFSQRGKGQSYPPGHPSYGERSSNFFWGQGGGQRVPKTLVPLDDGMDFQFAVKMLF